METLKDLRQRRGYSQQRAAEEIAPLVKRAVSTVRRDIIKAEDDGTDSISMLEALAHAYDVDFERVHAANTRLRSVQKMLQNSCA